MLRANILEGFRFFSKKTISVQTELTMHMFQVDHYTLEQRENLTAEEITHLRVSTQMESLILHMDMLKQEWHFHQVQESGQRSGCLAQILEASDGQNVVK